MYNGLVVQRGPWKETVRDLEVYTRRFYGGQQIQDAPNNATSPTGQPSTSTPVLAADPAASPSESAPATKEAGPNKTCDPNYTYNESLGYCVRNIVLHGCAIGQEYWNGAACTQFPECKEGYVNNWDTGVCELKPGSKELAGDSFIGGFKDLAKTCPAGQVLDPATNNCILDTNTLANLGNGFAGELANAAKVAADATTLDKKTMENLGNGFAGGLANAAKVAATNPVVTPRADSFTGGFSGVVQPKSGNAEYDNGKILDQILGACPSGTMRQVVNGKYECVAFQNEGTPQASTSKSSFKGWGKPLGVVDPKRQGHIN